MYIYEYIKNLFTYIYIHIHFSLSVLKCFYLLYMSKQHSVFKIAVSLLYLAGFSLILAQSFYPVRNEIELRRNIHA